MAVVWCGCGGGDKSYGGLLNIYHRSHSVARRLPQLCRRMCFGDYIAQPYAAYCHIHNYMICCIFLYHAINGNGLLVGLHFKRFISYHCWIAFVLGWWPLNNKVSKHFPPYFHLCILGEFFQWVVGERGYNEFG